MPDEVKEKALDEIDRLNRIPSASPEQGVIRTYVDWLVSLPWGVQTDDNLDLDESEKVLNEDHYGLEKVKERILEYMRCASSRQDPIADPALRGPSRVGRPLGKSIARAMGRKFVRMTWAASTTRPRSVATTHLIGALRVASSRASRRPSRRTRSSCSTRSTRSGWTSAAIRHRRCGGARPRAEQLLPGQLPGGAVRLSRVLFIATPTWSTPFPGLRDGWRSSSWGYTQMGGSASRSAS